VVQRHIGRQVHAIPETDAIQHPILLRNKVQVRLTRQFELALGEIELKHLVHRAQRSPRLLALLVIQVAHLVEGAPAGLVHRAPIHAVGTRPAATDDLQRGAHHRRTHGHHHVARGQQLPLRVVDLRQHTLAEEAGVEQLVVKHNAIDLPGQVVDVLAVRVHHSELVGGPVNPADLLLADAVQGGCRQGQVGDVERAVSRVGDDLRRGEISRSREQRNSGTHTDEEPPRVIANHVVFFSLLLARLWAHELADEIPHAFDVSLDRARQFVQHRQPSINVLHVRLPLQKQGDGLCLLRVAVVHAARRGLRIQSPLPSRGIPDWILRLQAARVMPVDQVHVELWLEWRRRGLLVAQHGLELPLLQLRGRVILVSQDDAVWIIGHLILLLLLGLRLRQRVELRVVRGVLLHQLVLLLLVPDLARLFRPRDQVLVARLFVEAFLEHLQSFLIVLHLQRCAACSEVALRPSPVLSDSLRRLHQRLCVLPQLEQASRAIAIDLVLLKGVSEQCPRIVLQSLLVLLLLERQIAQVLGLLRGECDHLRSTIRKLSFLHQCIQVALLA